MTLSFERLQAVKNTREFLRSLLDAKATPRVPKGIRRQAYWCLKHFPGEYDMQQAAQEAPAVFGINPLLPRYRK